MVEHPILVDLWVRNGWHAEHRALVVAEDCYPEYIAEHTRRLLRETPDLPVFLLHDATSNGVKMKMRLEASDRLPIQGHPVLDLGLFPRDVSRLEGMKWTGSRFSEYPRLPVDLLVPAVLIGGVTQGLDRQMPLA